MKIFSHPHSENDQTYGCKERGGRNVIKLYNSFFLSSTLYIPLFFLSRSCTIKAALHVERRERKKKKRKEEKHGLFEPIKAATRRQTSSEKKENNTKLYIGNQTTPFFCTHVVFIVLYIFPNKRRKCYYIITCIIASLFQLEMVFSPSVQPRKNGLRRQLLNTARRRIGCAPSLVHAGDDERNSPGYPLLQENPESYRNKSRFIPRF